MKVLYVTTISKTMLFFIDQFKSLFEMGHTVELACNCDIPLCDDKAVMGMKVYNIPFSRSPLSKDNLIAYRELKELIEYEKPDIVHCHTPNAAVITRLVCKGMRKYGINVFYTAHGFHFYKGAPLINWILYYPVEWICAHWTDVLITINNEDFALAKKKMKSKKIVYIPGVGINLNKYNRVIVDRKKKRAEIGIPENARLLISVGELNQNKNHETVIRAIAGMDVYYIIAGQGQVKVIRKNI
ncbi:MAG: glycosyltransferase family 4 protein [Tissierellia bacterium]|jgi:glycosyltransferase involved in cell wall biosynthesis|nr:glycosyltransferase family 4 protein [Tissierellia bacterium]